MYATIWNRDYILNFIANGLSAMAIIMINTTISSYCSAFIVASAAMTGIVVGMYSIGGGIMRPFAGPLVNRLDRRKLMAASFLVICLALLGIAFFRNYYVILACRLLMGFGNGVGITAGSLVSVDCTPKEHMGEGLGYFGISQTAVQAIASPLALWLRDRFSYRALVFAAIFILLVAAYLAMRISAPVKKEAPAERKPIRFSELISPHAWLPATVALLFAVVNGCVIAYTVDSGTEMGYGNVGLFFTLESIAMIGIRFVTGKLTDRKSMRFMINGCGVGLVAFVLLMSLGGHYWTYLAAGLIFGAAYGTILPVNQSTAIKSLPPEQSGTGMGTYLLGTDIGVALSGLIGGSVAGRVGYTKMFLFLLVPIAIGILLPNLFKPYVSAERE